MASGAAALVFQRYPSATPGQVKTLLTKTAQQVKGSSSGQGAGMIQVYDAIRENLPAASTSPSFYKLITGGSGNGHASKASTDLQTRWNNISICNRLMSCSG